MDLVWLKFIVAALNVNNYFQLINGTFTFCKENYPTLNQNAYVVALPNIHGFHG